MPDVTARDSNKTERVAELEKSLNAPMPLERRIALYQKLADMLEDEIENLDEHFVARQQIHHKLARTYLELGDEARAMRIARQLFELVDDARFASETIKMISLVEKFEKPERLTALSERLLNREPNNPEYALLYARQMHRNGATREAEFRALQLALELNPDASGILHSLVRCATGRTRVPSIEREAEQYAKRLVELSPAGGNFFVYGRLLLLCGKQKEALAIFEKIGPRVDRVTLGPLREVLGEFCLLCNRNYYYDSRTDIGSLRNSLEHSRKALKAFLNSEQTITTEQFSSAVRKLMPLRVLLFELARQAEVDDAVGEHFGTLDLHPYCVLADSFSEHVVMILEHALSEPVLSRPSKTNSSVRKLTELYVSLLLSMGYPSRARKQVEQVALLGFAQHIGRLLRDVTLLDDFESSKNTASRGDASYSTPNLHRMVAWDKWTAEQELARDVFVTAPKREIEYSVVMSSGELRRGFYAQQPFQLETVIARSIRLRDSELMIGPKGMLLQQHAIHGRYPPNLPSVLERTPHSVLLRPAEISAEIEEPVVVLAINNVARVYSYGHWIIFILSRLNAVVESGLLSDRKLLMPAEVTPWMKEMLSLIGLPEEKIIFHPRYQQTFVRDAKIVSPIDCSGSELFRKLKTKMRLAAGLDCTGRRTSAAPFVFLARKAQLRRMILDEDQIVSLAQRLGYAIVSPETLSVADQIRLFAGAAAIAGPGGSAFANIIFCEEGTRVLCLKAEEKVSPVVLDLAVANNLDFRWLLGLSVPALVRHMHPLDVPFRIDMNQLERQLVWAKQALEAV